MLYLASGKISRAFVVMVLVKHTHLPGARVRERKQAAVTDNLTPCCTQPESQVPPGTQPESQRLGRKEIQAEGGLCFFHISRDALNAVVLLKSSLLLPYPDLLSSHPKAPHIRECNSVSCSH